MNQTVKQIERNRLKNRRQWLNRQQRKISMLLMPVPFAADRTALLVPDKQMSYLKWVLYLKEVTLTSIPVYQTIYHQTVKSVERYCSIVRNDPSCRCCGKTEGKLSLDHYIPRSLGGNNKLLNLQILCQSCNSIKGSHVPIDAWMIWEAATNK